MSWEIFKQNILRVANNPDGIPDTDTVANLYATEYDAAIKRGHDTINNVTLMHGNVDIMKQMFKAALEKGLTVKEPYDLVGQMGEGVKAYWAGATLNQYPIPKIPAVGSTQNVSVTSNVVTNMGQWQTSISKASSVDLEADENGNKDDTPAVETKDKEQYEKRNNVIIEADEGVEPKSEEITLTQDIVTDIDLLAQKPPVEVADDPGDWPPKRKTGKPHVEPFRFGASKQGNPPGAYPPGNLGPAPKVYGNVGSSAYPGADDFRKNYKNAQIPLSALVGIETGAKGRYTYKGKRGWMLLHPEAANQYFKLKAAALAAGISWTISSAYRDFAHQTELIGDVKRDTVASAGSSPHGWGGAIDFAELYAVVGGIGDPSINKAGREKSPLYRWLSNNAPQFGWYNPARLADNSGTDEMWHWEYWGHWAATPPKASTETNTGDYVTFNIDKNLPTAIIWGGIDFATPSWMAQQIPQELKNSKKIIIAPYTIPLETILIKFKGIKVNSVSGFSAGGNQCWPYAGKYSFTGLIDPSTSEKAVTSASTYASSWSGVVMYYNNGNWNNKYKAIGERQVTAAGYLGANAIKVSLNHSAIPAKFFQLYGHKL